MTNFKKKRRTGRRGKKNITGMKPVIGQAHRIYFQHCMRNGDLNKYTQHNVLAYHFRQFRSNFHIYFIFLFLNLC